MNCLLRQQRSQSIGTGDIVECSTLKKNQHLFSLLKAHTDMHMYIAVTNPYQTGAFLFSAVYLYVNRIKVHQGKGFWRGRIEHTAERLIGHEHKQYQIIIISCVFTTPKLVNHYTNALIET